MTSERSQLATSNQQPATLEEGFTLIELLIVMSIIIVIMLLAIPSVNTMTKNAHQVSAVQTMRTIASAEMGYKSSYATFGYGCPLNVLGGDPKAGAPSAQAAQLIDPTLASTGQKSGYVFTVTCGSKSTVNNQDVYDSVEIIGVPRAIGKTGDNGYCDDQDGNIKIDPAGGTNCTQPLQ
jgi:type IV pilus assembly protein PilA